MGGAQESNPISAARDPQTAPVQESNPTYVARDPKIAPSVSINGFIPAGQILRKDAEEAEQQRHRERELSRRRREREMEEMHIFRRREPGTIGSSAQHAAEAQRREAEIREEEKNK